jgi:putative membrane protein
VDEPAAASGSDNRNELAKERNRAAADRTLLAWIRTSLALIGFGFGIDRIVNVISAEHHHNQSGLTAIIGLSFMALGIFAIVSAAATYRRELQQLARQRYTYEVRRPYALIVALVLAAIGAIGFGGILVQVLRAG